MKPKRVLCSTLAALSLGGCVTTYQLTLMPRTSGTLYYGEAIEDHAASQAKVSVTIADKTYAGSWVYSSPAQASAYLGAGSGWRGARAGGLVTVYNPSGGEAKALLRAADGSGLRCDLHGMASGNTGGGACSDDKGLVYDVQVRTKAAP